MGVDQTMSWYTSTPMCSPESVQVLILAGGRGTRLRVAGTPKLMISVTPDGAETPMIGVALESLARLGYRNVSLLTGRDPQAGGALIESYATSAFGDRLRLSVFREHHQLGTAGAVYAAMRHVRADVVAVVPGDTLFPFQFLAAVLAAHDWLGRQVTWVVTTEPGPDAQNTNALILDPATGHIVFALEGLDTAPSAEVTASLEFATSTGLLIFDRAFFVDAFEGYVSRLAQPEATDLYRQFLPWLISRGEVVGAFDIQSAAPDLGTPERLLSFGGKRMPTDRR